MYLISHAKDTKVSHNYMIVGFVSELPLWNLLLNFLFIIKKIVDESVDIVKLILFNIDVVVGSCRCFC